MGLTALPEDEDRAATVAAVRALCPHLCENDIAVSPLRGGRGPATARMQRIDAERYGRTRNHLEGAVTRLSPYVRHGVVDLAELRDHLLSGVGGAKRAEKLVQQLAWRDYWQRLYADLGTRIWEDIEPYKTGFPADSYADVLPDDILAAETGVAAIDHFLRELYATGWLHNHARLYVAAYVCHWRRVKWQAGARLFLAHLLDGDPASNNLSWQWVASTFSHKPYFFNLENLQTFCGDDVDTRFASNTPLAGSYPDIHARLFPLLPPREADEQHKPRKGAKRRRRAHH